ncbi:MAG: ankyrin repeat domain-containing protein [Puniceicoccales bacterium]|jgi:hypothetical protein|nr:ankyrin repeat domain-containing protein [Puniceicoccales bacterium]
MEKKSNVFFIFIFLGATLPMESMGSSESISREEDGNHANVLKNQPKETPIDTTNPNAPISDIEPTPDMAEEEPLRDISRLQPIGIPREAPARPVPGVEMRRVHPNAPRYQPIGIPRRVMDLGANLINMFSNTLPLANLLANLGIPMVGDPRVHPNVPIPPLIPIPIVGGPLPRIAIELPLEFGSWTENEQRMFIALSSGDWETARFYVEAGTDPNFIVDYQHRKTLLTWMVDQWDENLISESIPILALNPKFEPSICDIDGNTAAHICVFKNYAVALNRLLDLPKLKINTRGKLGSTILHLITMRLLPLPNFGLWEEVLLRILSNPTWDYTAQDNAGITVENLLTIMEGRIGDNAIARANIAILRQEIAEVKIGRSETNLEAELRDIIMEEDVEKLREWLAKNPNIDVNWQDPLNENRTPLMYAVTTGNIKIVRAIAALPGINPKLTDREGKTALFYAEANCEGKIIKLIKSISPHPNENLAEEEIPSLSH